MKLSAIVPAYNEEKTIGGCLDSLLDQTRPFDETVVVDNASTDGGPEAPLRQALLASFVLAPPKALEN